jgi:hypothetical protein
MGPNSTTKLTHLTFCHLWWVQEKSRKMIKYVIWLINLNANDFKFGKQIKFITRFLRFYFSFQIKSYSSHNILKPHCKEKLA